MARLRAEAVVYTGPDKFSWHGSNGIALDHGEWVTRTRVTFFNGEHWARVTRADGDVTTVPDILLEDAATRALPRCTVCGKACSHPSGTHTGCATWRENQER